MLRFWTACLALVIAPPAAADGMELKPQCAGMSEGAECWTEIANKPGCYLLNPYYSPPEKVTCREHAPAASLSDKEG